MQRETARLTDERYDLLIVGGGILGAFLAREATSHGFRIALLEKNDFASGTTAGSGKVLHGGLRYLRHLAFGLAREARREQARIASLTPGLVRPLPFLVPCRNGRLAECVGLRAARWGWQGFRAVTGGEDALPQTRYLAREELDGFLSGKGGDTLGGALLFHDFQIRSPERLTLALLRDAWRRGAALANYLDAVRLVVLGGRVRGVVANDHIGGEELEIGADLVVNASGAWTSDLADQAAPGALPKMTFAKGVHVVLDLPAPPAAIALPLHGQRSGSPLSSERRVFLTPWEGRTLLGPTYSPYRGSPDDLEPQKDEIETLLSEVDRQWPGFHVGDARPLYTYAGLYPLFDGAGVSRHRFQAAIHPRIVDHGALGGPSGLVSVVSVKLTTAGALADRLLELCVAHLDRTRTRVKRTRGTQGNGLPRDLTVPPVEVEGVGPDAISGAELSAGVESAVEQEMALRLTDFFFRRTWIGHLGCPSDRFLDRASHVMRDRLGWTEEQRRREVARVLESYRTLPSLQRRNTPRLGGREPAVGTWADLED